MHFSIWKQTVTQHCSVASAQNSFRYRKLTAARWVFQIRSIVIYSHIELSTNVIQAKRRMQSLLIYSACVPVSFFASDFCFCSNHHRHLFPLKYSIHSLGRSFRETHFVFRSVTNSFEMHKIRTVDKNCVCLASFLNFSSSFEFFDKVI